MKTKKKKKLITSNPSPVKLEIKKKLKRRKDYVCPKGLKIVLISTPSKKFIEINCGLFIYILSYIYIYRSPSSDSVVQDCSESTTTLSLKILLFQSSSMHSAKESHFWIHQTFMGPMLRS